VDTITLDHVTLDIVQDEAPESPRGWDCLGKMVCWHRRYRLGDAHDYPTPAAFASAVDLRRVVNLPLYLMEHSGLTLTTDPAPLRAFDPDGWDWRAVGWIYAEAHAVRREYGGHRLTRRVRALAEDALRAEVETYAAYLRGDVYAFTVTDTDTGDLLDACGGFYGGDIRENGMLDHLSEPHRAVLLKALEGGRP
jgi:hypothetical protein